MAKLIAGFISFLCLVGSNIYFSAGCGQDVYLIQDAEKYTYGELVYQLGIIIAILTMFIFYRIGAEGWGLKLFLNWCIEIYLIAAVFTITSNPYSMNWDKMLFLTMSFSGMVVLYLICYLFPTFRRLII